jgi:phosphocarrier protein
MKAETDRLSARVRVVNELGLHARSAAAIARLAAKARSGVSVSKEGRAADASSVMDLLTLECPRGTELTVSVRDASDAAILEQIVELVRSGFGE